MRPTPRTIEGPFYPDVVPSNAGGDLVSGDCASCREMQIVHLLGRVVTTDDTPVAGAVVEIWQVDSHGSYIHVDGRGAAGRDERFSGYGHVVTEVGGEYRFRTVRPRSYTLMGIFRSPHVHVAISVGGQRVLTTQIGVRGDPDNKRDPLFGALDQDALGAMLADFTLEPETGEFFARCDFVIDLLSSRSGVEGTATAGPPERRKPKRGWRALASASERHVVAK